MSSFYKTNVNGIFDFDIDQDSVDKTDISQNADASYHILKDHIAYRAIVDQKDFLSKKYIVSINNTSYEVAISDELDIQIEEMGFSLGTSKQVNSIKAPMPGLLLDIMISANQEVKENDPLLILEAMKMENVILSPRDGIIKSISKTKGATVEKGQMLIEFE